MEICILVHGGHGGVQSDRDKMSESGVEQPAKKAASPLYLGFDFSTQQVRNMVM